MKCLSTFRPTFNKCRYCLFFWILTLILYVSLYWMDIGISSPPSTARSSTSHEWTTPLPSESPRAVLDMQSLSPVAASSRPPTRKPPVSRSEVATPYMLRVRVPPNLTEDLSSVQSQSLAAPSTTPGELVWKLLDVKATLSLPLPHFGNYQCRDQICSEFLTDGDKNDLLHCSTNRITKLVPRCHFMDGAHRSAVALISFPGSGNTWIRGLLEKATGICTGG